jgi:nucleotidyltransferase/DNA polymerase involved in DNA repair
MIAAIRMLNFALRVAVLGQPELDGAPLVLGPIKGDRPKALDCTPEAAALGVRIGMSLRDVVASCPLAQVVAADPVREEMIASQIQANFEQLSPAVEADATERGCWYLDLHGLDRLFGAPEEIAQAILHCVPPGLRPRVGIADGKFPARVTAGNARPGGLKLIAAGATKKTIAPEPVSTLPMPVDMIKRLEQLGIATLGFLAELPPSAMAARFGPAGLHAWELANGRDPAPVVPRAYQEIIVEKLEFPLPTASRDTLLLALRFLVQRASHRPLLQHRGARQVRVRAIYEGGGSWEKQITMREPVRGYRLAELLRLRFQSLELPQLIATLEIELSDLSGETARHELLIGLRPRQVRPLVNAARQLKARYGVSPLFRIVEVEPWSRIPERRHALMPYDP